MDRMPWLAQHKHLYAFCEYVGTSMLDIEPTSSPLRNGFILMAKIRARIGFYGFPVELWLFSYVKKMVRLAKKLLARPTREDPAASQPVPAHR